MDHGFQGWRQLQPGRNGSRKGLERHGAARSERFGRLGRNVLSSARSEGTGLRRDSSQSCVPTEVVGSMEVHARETEARALCPLDNFPSKCLQLNEQNCAV
jgi:hypothetical protein